MEVLMSRSMTPSENEWIVMEVLWENDSPMTASEIIMHLKGVKDVSPKTIRVLINRLLKKEIIDYTVDPHDARVYHYFPIKSRSVCLEEKSEHFVNSYFRGNSLGMVAALVEQGHFSQEQMNELIEIINNGRGKGKETS